jgi:hypothetical protein
MAKNLLRDSWKSLDADELLIFLRDRFHTFGQFDNSGETAYFPLGLSSCQIKVSLDASKVVGIEPGAAFAKAKWLALAGDLDKTLITSVPKVGRDYSFSGHRVLGSWRGNRSGVQIVPPPARAPRAPYEMAEHPFILEFPLKASSFWPITNHRRLTGHRSLSLLLNALLSPRISAQSVRHESCWATIYQHQGGNKWIETAKRVIRRLTFRPAKRNEFTTMWVQKSFFAELNDPVSDVLSPISGERLEEFEPDDYYTNVRGYDGKGLRVPSDLDESICRYIQLSSNHKEKFDRAAFWLDLASRQWTMSMSASFAALVTAIEALTEGRGDIHNFDCPVCGKPTQHESPGATRRFKDFFDTYAPGAALAKRRDKLYDLRSDIVHGSKLTDLDRTFAIGMTPRQSMEDDLNRELWGLTRTAIRNWLNSPV